jgi:subtilisin family serine protease
LSYTSSLRDMWVDARAPETVRAPQDEAAVGRNVRIGVIDSGWDRSQPDENIKSGVAFTPPVGIASPDDNDVVGHGTACCRLIRSVAPGAELVPIRVFFHTLETTPESLVRAIDWAVENEIQLLNLSLGTTRNDAVKLMYQACERARRSGVILVAAGGPGMGWSYPAVFECVLGVARDDRITGNIVKYRSTELLECAASGSHSVRALGGRLIRANSSSFAAPIVTGTIAKIMECHPTFDLDRVRQYMAGLNNQSREADQHAS